MHFLTFRVSETGLGCGDLQCDAPNGLLAAGTCCRHVLVHGFLGRGWTSTCVVLGRL